MSRDLGIYISVPFCRAKCTYCNFASGVFGAERMGRYVVCLIEEIEAARERASALNVHLSREVDSLYFGGGTPSLLSPEQIRAIFTALRRSFSIRTDAEITLECAPGQLEDQTLQQLLEQGMNRISFGVQSFVDAETRAVGRSHTRETCLAEISRLRRNGVQNINVDLIAGLPHQTAASWRDSAETAIASGVPHVSIYMLEVDDESRLGREVLAAGERYAADSIPSEDEVAEAYSEACFRLEASGLAQYEISNFARAGFAARHNERYWLRHPYLGFGLDAHSMLEHLDTSEPVTLRLANTADLDLYLGSQNSPDRGSLPLYAPEKERCSVVRIDSRPAFEETLFLGLRRTAGVDLTRVAEEFGTAWVTEVRNGVADAVDAGLLEFERDHLRLTSAGRMVSNEVFERVLLSPVA